MLSDKSPVLLMAVLSAFSIACGDQPTSPEAVTTIPQQNFSNGPDELPNVFRFEGIVGGAVVVDQRTDLLVIDGLPDDPTTASICGGTQDIANLADFQVSGDLTGVFQVLVQSELNIHVYRLSTFESICTSQPIAQGRGRLTINDNDAAGSGTRANTFGHRLTGSVTLSDGGTAHLTSYSRFLIDRNGTFQLVSSGVQLSR